MPPELALLIVWFQCHRYTVMQITGKSDLALILQKSAVLLPIQEGLIVIALERPTLGRRIPRCSAQSERDSSE
jgi:hypothetical protein